MICSVETHSDAKFSFDPVALFERVTEYTLTDLGCPFEAQVTLMITDDEEIKKINAAHRKIDQATDVLSFPAFTFASPARFSGIEEDLSLQKDPETGAVWLGDIVISYEAVERQAEFYGHSAMREFAFLSVHALLHLTGYDHETEEDERMMEEKQEAVLCALQITREA